MTGGRNVEGQTYTVIAENNLSLVRNLTSSREAGLQNARQYAASSQASAQYAAPEVQAAPSFNLISGIETSSASIGITYANAFMT